MKALPDTLSAANFPPRQLPEDQEEWVISMKGKLMEAKKYVGARTWKKWCIYRAPCRLKDAHGSKAYVPQTVSIGPYHHSNEQVQDMNCQKWIALNRNLDRTGRDLSLYWASIKEVEQEARACYQQDLRDLNSNNFVEMMILDGCFIIELFRCSPKVGERSNHADRSFIYNLRTLDDILLDMVMLENQVPLFIIDRLLECMAGNSLEQQKAQATTLALNLFSPEWLTGAPLTEQELIELKISLQTKDCLHILDVFRRSLIYSGPQDNPAYRPRKWRLCDRFVPKCLNNWFQATRVPDRIPRHGQVIHSVTELRQSGVKFKRRNTKCFWDIKFKNGVLEMPTLWIQDATMSILLNVAAFEHCHLAISDAKIVPYTAFMACLIKSPEDVCYLHQHGIIQHLLGDDAEVVDMLKCVSKEMFFDAYGSHYATIAEEVNAYCNQKRNKWRASLVQKYFNNPWAIISLVAALILLLLTATQTFYAVYSYYRPT